MSETHEGYFLIADITGYTRYLSESELEHAQDTLTALLKLLVDNTVPPLVISRLAGDAVISYGLLESFFLGQTFLETIEDTYVTFRKTLQRLVLNNNCRCNACANIATLDLKFFIHYGTFGIQRISDHDELVGSDINLLHRLLKNSVGEKTGFQGYALLTEAAIQQLAINGLEDTMVPITEEYEYLGEVKVWVQDMHAVWEKKRKTVAVLFPDDQLAGSFEIDIALPREIVWDYLTQPEFRTVLIGADRMDIANRAQGRIAEGSIYQCYHGDKLIPQTILEWQPLESMIVKEVFSMSHATSSLNEYTLESITGGTRLTRRIANPTGPLIGRSLMSLVFLIFRNVPMQGFEAFAQLIEEDYRARSLPPEPEVTFSVESIREAAFESLQASATDQAGTGSVNGVPD